MDPLFVANPSEAEIGEALNMWPELSGLRVRPLLVSAFGDVFVETEAGMVLVASPIEISCEQVAASVDELERLFSDPEWGRLKLMTDVALLARDKGIERPQGKVFAVAPHPKFTGTILAEHLMPMDLQIWHHIALSIRHQTGPVEEGTGSPE